MSSASRTGKQVGSYVICEEIGGGAMGRVWRGLDQALGRPVAIKMLRADLANRDGLIERFRIEAQVLARLSHPNIAMIYALVEEEGDLYLVMEYVKGETLHSQLARSGALDLADCFPLFHRALEGIQHAHEAGVVHRDIKPSNLMLGPGGQVKWIDFGIAHVRGRERMTRAGGLVGTPEYMAPEQVRGESGTIRSDIYSLGVVLYKMLTGRPPFAGQGEFEVMRAQIECSPARPRELGADVSAELENVLLKALAKDPAARFPSAVALQQALIDAGAPDAGVSPIGAAAARLAAEAAGGGEITLFDTGMRPPEPTLAAPAALGNEVPETRDLSVPRIASAEPSATHPLPVFTEDHVETLQLADEKTQEVEIAEVLPARTLPDCERAPSAGLAARRPPPESRPLSWPRLALMVAVFAAIAANWITPPTVSESVPASLAEPADLAATPVLAEEAVVETEEARAVEEQAVAAPSPPPAKRRAAKPPQPKSEGWEIRR